MSDTNTGRQEESEEFASGEHILRHDGYEITVTLRENRVSLSNLDTLKADIVQATGAAILAAALTPGRNTVEKMQKAVAARFSSELTNVVVEGPSL